jgi:anti-anti-sigma factor
VEREFARLLDEHGIAWLYEPHTFVLERDASGGIRQAFSPDFYLPEFELYVECTVKRQALTNLKRRKAAKASRSGIRVEVLYRRDIEGLARRWSLDRLAAAARGTTEPAGFEHPPTGYLRSVDTAAAEPFAFEEERTAGGTAVLRVRGEADLFGAPAFQDRLVELVEAGTTHIVVDLTKATFVDSMMLGVLLRCSKRIGSTGGRLRLVIGSSEIRRLFEITLLDRVFDIDADCESAVTAIEQAAVSPL